MRGAGARIRRPTSPALRGLPESVSTFQLCCAIRRNECRARIVRRVLPASSLPLPQDGGARSVLRLQTAEATQLSLALNNVVKTNRLNSKCSCGCDVRLDVVDEDRLRRVELIRRKEMLIDRRFRLAVANTRRDHLSAEEIPEIVFTLEVFHRERRHVRQTKDPVSGRVDATQQRDGVCVRDK